MGQNFTHDKDFVFFTQVRGIKTSLSTTFSNGQFLNFGKTFIIIGFRVSCAEICFTLSHSEVFYILINPKDSINLKGRPYVTTAWTHLVSNIFNIHNHIYNNQNNSFCE